MTMRPPQHSPSVNRRGFLKTSVLTATALAILSTGTALANPASGSGSGGNTPSGPVIKWKLIIDTDPYSAVLGWPASPPLHPADELAYIIGRANGAFRNEGVTRFDPVGPGDDANTFIKTTVISRQCPKAGDVAVGFQFRLLQTGELILNGTPALTLNEGHDPGQDEDDQHNLEGFRNLLYSPVEMLVEIRINQQGFVTISADPIKKKAHGSAYGAWISEHSVAPNEIYTVGKATHSFESAYSAEAGVGFTFELKQIFKMDGSASVAVNPNHLAPKTAEASLRWSVLRLKEYYSSASATSPYDLEYYPLFNT